MNYLSTSARNSVVATQDPAQSTGDRIKNKLRVIMQILAWRGRQMRTLYLNARNHTDNSGTGPMTSRNPELATKNYPNLLLGQLWFADVMNIIFQTSILYFKRPRGHKSHRPTIAQALLILPKARRRRSRSPQNLTEPCTQWQRRTCTGRARTGHGFHLR